MSEPAKCPYCGYDDPRFCDWEGSRTSDCFNREITALQAENKRLREACEAVLYDFRQGYSINAARAQSLIAALANKESE